MRDTVVFGGWLGVCLCVLHRSNLPHADRTSCNRRAHEALWRTSTTNSPPRCCNTAPRKRNARWRCAAASGSSRTSSRRNKRRGKRMPRHACKRRVRLPRLQKRSWGRRLWLELWRKLRPRSRACKNRPRQRTLDVCVYRCVVTCGGRCLGGVRLAVGERMQQCVVCCAGHRYAAETAAIGKEFSAEFQACMQDLQARRKQCVAPLSLSVPRSA